MIHFMKNVSIAGGFLFLIVHGAGNYALDNRAGRLTADRAYIPTGYIWLRATTMVALLNAT